MHIEDIYISLIIKYLKNEISDAEKQKLFHWVYDKTDNETFFYHLKDIWETARFENVAGGANTSAEWEKLALAAIKEESEHFYDKQTLTRNLYRTLKIAGIVIITFGIGFFVQKYLPEEISYASVNVPYGAKSELELPDGSRVWVNSGSVLKYPVNLDAKEVNLFLEGEAFFDIAKNTRRNLNVKTSSINIHVHGTTFNVKSYNEEDVVETTLIEGSISITGKVGERIIKDPIYLKPNEQATLIKSQGNVEFANSNNPETKETPSAPKIKELPGVMPHMQITEGIDAEKFVMWKYNILVFKNERFEDLSVKLERWYDVEINIKDSVLKNSRYTGTFEKENIEQALDALSLSLPFKYTIDKNKITIIKK